MNEFVYQLDKTANFNLISHFTWHWHMAHSISEIAFFKNLDVFFHKSAISAFSKKCNLSTSSNYTKISHLSVCNADPVTCVLSNGKISTSF